MTQMKFANFKYAKFFKYNVSEERYEYIASAHDTSILRIVKFFGSTVDFVCFSCQSLSYIDRVGACAHHECPYYTVCHSSQISLDYITLIIFKGKKTT